MIKKIMTILIILITLALFCNTSKADQYYLPPVIAQPYPVITYNTNIPYVYNGYSYPRLQYVLVPNTTQTLISPAPLYGFRWLRKPVYQTTTEWRLVPIVRY